MPKILSPENQITPPEPENVADNSVSVSTSREITYSEGSSGSSSEPMTLPTAGATAVTTRQQVTSSRIPFGTGRHATYGSGIVTISVVAVDGNGNAMYNGALNGDTAQILSACLTAEELAAVSAGAELQIRLTVTDEPPGLTTEEKQTFAAAYPGLTVAGYYDLTLEKKLGNADWTKITAANGELTISLDVPEGLVAPGRRFSVLRLHEGAITLLPDIDAEDETVTIATGLFSTYALTYEDDAKTQKQNAPASPKTGDRFPATISGIIAAAALLLRRILAMATQI